MSRFFASVAVATSFLAASASAQTPPTTHPNLVLFGTSVQGATRMQLRDTFKKRGLKPVREDNRYWVDIYDPKGILEGASSFQAGYVMKTGRFAFAQYTFNGFMNAGLVTKVADMVTTKYGRPSSHSGSDGLGNVTYKWALPHGMYIEVSRGWPDTTTYLAYIDRVANAEMDTEHKADVRAQEKSKAEAQSDAF